MLIVCNGAIKSGSTWLYNILAALLEPSRPPNRYLTAEGRVNATIKPEKLRAFLESEDFHARNYLTKNHLGKPEHKSLLFSFRDVVVVDIVRDIRDVVVSAYFDAKNRNGLVDSFEEFYWRSGRELADAVTKYHRLWAPESGRILRVSYEGLQSDFSTEIAGAAKFFELELTAERVDALRVETSMVSLKKRYESEELYGDDKFFRKGVVGDWQNHFSESMLRDIARIEKAGLGVLDRRVLLRKARARLGF